jgi:hypothetical protein
VLLVSWWSAMIERGVAVAMSQAPGWSGTPESGHWRARPRTRPAPGPRHAHVTHQTVSPAMAGPTHPPDCLDRPMRVGRHEGNRLTHRPRPQAAYFFMLLAGPVLPARTARAWPRRRSPQLSLANLDLESWGMGLGGASPFDRFLEQAHLKIRSRRSAPWSRRTARRSPSAVPEKRTLAPFELGWSPSPASMTPAFMALR